MFKVLHAALHPTFVSQARQDEIFEVLKADCIMHNAKSGASR
jgi:hypothetical protein